MKVCILAAGMGSRLGSRTKNFNKAFIRVGDIGAISHIMNYFPLDYEFVITTGYLGNELEQYISICHPERKIKFVKNDKWSGKGSGPGYSLLQCKEYLQEKFYLWTVDTLVSNFSIDEEEDNWIGYCEAQNRDGEYSCVELFHKIVVNFHEKKADTYTNNAYIGCAFIKDYKEFWKGMLENPVVVQDQYQVSAGFYEILKEKWPIAGKRLEWHDIGNLEKLQKTRSHFPAKIENLDKDDEEIYFFDDKFVVKYFKDEKIAQNRVKRSQTLGATVPEIIQSSKNFYAYKYTKGKDLFNVENPQIYLLDLLNFAKDNLWQEKKLNPEEFRKFQETCVDFYYKKTKNRVDSLYEKLHLFDKREKIRYDCTDEEVPSLSDIFDSLDWQKLLNGKPTLMHGDFNFSNILVQPDNTFKFIDWRQDFGGMINVGDMYYDLAKMYSGFVFPHDIVKKDHFEFYVGYETVELQMTKYDKYVKCEEIFIKFLKDNNIDVQKVKQLAAIVLLNMSPLHAFPLNVYLYYVGKYLLWKTINE